MATRIPGPAGLLKQLQAANTPPALLQAALNDALVQGSHSIPTAHASGGGRLEDTYPAWRAALECFDISPDDVRNPMLSNNIGWILAQGKTCKVPRVLAVIQTMAYSPSGGAHVLLKDMTGVMKAAVHPSVLDQQSAFGPGAALALKQISVVCPLPNLAYLCITSDNVTQVFPPPGPQFPSSRATQPAAPRPSPEQPVLMSIPAPVPAAASPSPAEHVARGNRQPHPHQLQQHRPAVSGAGGGTGAGPATARPTGHPLPGQPFTQPADSNTMQQQRGASVRAGVRDESATGGVRRAADVSGQLLSTLHCPDSPTVGEMLLLRRGGTNNPSQLAIPRPPVSAPATRQRSVEVCDQHQQRTQVLGPSVQAVGATAPQQAGLTQAGAAHGPGVGAGGCRHAGTQPAHTIPRQGDKHPANDGLHAARHQQQAGIQHGSNGPGHVIDRSSSAQHVTHPPGRITSMGPPPPVRPTTSSLLAPPPPPHQLTTQGIPAGAATQQPHSGVPGGTRSAGQEAGRQLGVLPGQSSTQGDDEDAYEDDDHEEDMPQFSVLGLPSGRLKPQPVGAMQPAEPPPPRAQPANHQPRSLLQGLTLGSKHGRSQLASRQGATQLGGAGRDVAAGAGAGPGPTQGGSMPVAGAGGAAGAAHQGLVAHTKDPSDSNDAGYLASLDDTDTEWSKRRRLYENYVPVTQIPPAAPEPPGPAAATQLLGHLGQGSAQAVVCGGGEQLGGGRAGRAGSGVCSPHAGGAILHRSGLPAQAGPGQAASTGGLVGGSTGPTHPMQPHANVGAPRSTAAGVGNGLVGNAKAQPIGGMEMAAAGPRLMGGGVRQGLGQAGGGRAAGGGAGAAPGGRRSGRALLLHEDDEDVELQDE